MVVVQRGAEVQVQQGVEVQSTEALSADKGARGCQIKIVITKG